ncbi:hypothetical protein ACSSVY_004469, partial [Roseovarius sp. MBR-51]
KTLHAKFGELTLEDDFLSDFLPGALDKAGLLPSAKNVWSAPLLQGFRG